MTKGNKFPYWVVFENKYNQPHTIITTGDCETMNHVSNTLNQNRVDKCDYYMAVGYRNADDAIKGLISVNQSGLALGTNDYL